jgi:putative tryptophan/tyrosine transport system substrate-binding protein
VKKRGHIKTCLSLIGFVLASIHFAEAQQSAKILRIGYLTIASLSSNVARVEAFRQGLREHGYVEGKNVLIEWRSRDGKLSGINWKPVA